VLRFEKKDKTTVAQRVCPLSPVPMPWRAAAPGPALPGGLRAGTLRPRTMHKYVEARKQSQAVARQGALLDRIIARPEVHARLLNTLARLEYVGVRKMLKSRRAERLDLGGLEHMLDETVHALRLKKAALAVAPDARAVATFDAADTLAGDEGEEYLQAIDHAAEATLGDLPEDRRSEANYLLSSAAIEVRAQSFYPLYDARLRAHGIPVSLSSIMRDEDRHLAEMTAGLEALLPAWRARIEAVLDREEALYARFVDALERAAPAERP
jgi:hypothetical protein